MILSFRNSTTTSKLSFFNPRHRRRPPLLLKGLIVCLAGLVFSPATIAAEIPAPEGDVLLVISGKLTNTNVNGEAHITRAMLESLPSVEFDTNTPWADGVQNFVGVRISDLFDFIGASPESYIAEGLDDYKFTITDIDVERYPVIIAYLHNGSPMSVRKLGPLRIMFPFDDFPELLTPKNQSSAVWQLIKMELL